MAWTPWKIATVASLTANTLNPDIMRPLRINTLENVLASVTCAGNKPADMVKEQRKHPPHRDPHHPGPDPIPHMPFSDLWFNKPLNPLQYIHDASLGLVG